ncbi:MAG: hypothetical protein ACLP19_05850 [Xanthobacteraceae bacterium]
MNDDATMMSFKEVMQWLNLTEEQLQSLLQQDFPWPDKNLHGINMWWQRQTIYQYANSHPELWLTVHRLRRAG